MGNAMLDAVDQERTRRDAQSDRERTAAEYRQLLLRADPAQATRLLDLGKSLGLSADTVRGDVASTQATAAAAAKPAAPATMPAADRAKLNGAQLVALAIREQNEAASARQATPAAVAASAQAAPPAPAPAAPDLSKLNGAQLMREAFKQSTTTPPR